MKQAAVVTACDTAVYRVPTELPEADGTAAWSQSTIVVVSLHADGLVGIGYTYGPGAVAAVIDDLLRPIVVGSNVLHVGRVWVEMQHAVRNATRAGIAGYAISAVDVALWDLKAKALGLSLVDLLGGVRDDVAVYGSGGFTTFDPTQLGRQLRSWARARIPRVKIKIAEDWGRHESRDLERIAYARSLIGLDAELYVDANGGYDVKQAVRVMGACEESRVTWFEEPVSSDDLAGLARVRGQVTADVTAGEYGTDVAYFERMCASGAVDCLQIDATRCGGYSEWLRAAAVAAAHHLEVSAHCAPHLHAPVAAATPNIRHIEWFSDHVRVEELVFSGCLDPDGGTVRPDRGVLGHGLHVRGGAERYRVHA